MQQNIDRAQWLGNGIYRLGQRLSAINEPGNKPACSPYGQGHDGYGRAKGRMLQVMAGDLGRLADQLEVLVDPGHAKEAQDGDEKSEDDQWPGDAGHALRRVRRRLCPWLAGKGEKDLPAGVKGGEQSSDGQQQPHYKVQALARPKVAAARETKPGVGQDLVLAPETGPGKDAGQSQRADDESPAGAGHAPQQATHVHHVVGVELLLLVAMIVVFMASVVKPMVHTMDHRTRSHEEKRLEEGVGDEVEHARHVGPRSQGSEHVAKLADSRIGQYPFDVVLGQGDGAGKEGGEGTDEGHYRHLGSAGHSDEQREGASHQVDAGRDHRRGVDEGADRGRAFHGVR